MGQYEEAWGINLKGWGSMGKHSKEKGHHGEAWANTLNARAAWGSTLKGRGNMGKHSKGLGQQGAVWKSHLKRWSSMGKHGITL